ILVVDGTGDTDDFGWGLVVDERDALADRVVAGPEGLAGRLIHDGYARCGLSILHAEIAAAHERDADSAEIARPYDRDQSRTRRRCGVVTAIDAYGTLQPDRHWVVAG